MKCPKCNKSMKVIDSRVIGDRRIRRRYCNECDYDMFTAEQKISNSEGMRLMGMYYSDYREARRHDGKESTD